jgi:hypothetical protein
MKDENSIISILNAIDQINSKPKKKITNAVTALPSIPKLNQDSIVPLDVDKLILEAETYKRSSKILSKTILDKTHSPLQENENILILTNEVIDNSVNKNKKIEEKEKKILALEKIEKKLFLQIDVLKKDKILYSKNYIDIAKEEEPKNSVNILKESLKSIYKQVEEQKKIFLDLQNYSIKIERDSKVYRENYERLVIENNELKNRLNVAKEQIVNHETSKTNLLSALDKLNEILSASNIVGKISPKEALSNNSDKIESKKIDSID